MRYAGAEPVLISIEATRDPRALEAVQFQTRGYEKFRLACLELMVKNGQALPVAEADRQIVERYLSLRGGQMEKLTGKESLNEALDDMDVFHR